MIALFKRQQVQQGCILHQAALTRVAMAWCHDSCLADDLSQECITKAISNCHQLKDMNKLKSWLMQILNNCWRDYLRRRHEHEDIDKLVLSQPDNAALDLTQSRLAKQVQHAVALLPLVQRQVVTLVDLYDSGYQEVADILEIPVGTVMSRLSRARNALAQTLSEHRPDSNITPIKPRGEI